MRKVDELRWTKPKLFAVFGAQLRSDRSECASEECARKDSMPNEVRQSCADLTDVRSLAGDPLKRIFGLLDVKSLCSAAQVTQVTDIDAHKGVRSAWLKRVRPAGVPRLASYR